MQGFLVGACLWGNGTMPLSGMERKTPTFYTIAMALGLVMDGCPEVSWTGCPGSGVDDAVDGGELGRCEGRGRGGRKVIVELSHRADADDDGGDLPVGEQP